ncbi:site-specific recombinase, phage integrase family [Methylophaga frappieri]|uniref:Site-specific recombinase, phage integrase family n=1 Tax=Methylophaga frappieri (strain ATCC BAA-2434 / DSM 25690 / JAM7) TaxID=754477 RepID=I1YI46_METFJ|nr:site-specific integrase [Methylophaga frappieri]AFJ02589.1 site-specific recombinase, phage integrase family [Methylophaga frappieri]
MASYIKRGEGQWQAKVRKKGYPVQTKTFRNKSLAQKWATQVEAQMDNKMFISSTLAETTTVQQLTKRYITEILPSKKSAVSMGSMIRCISNCIGEYAVISITPSVLADYRDTRLKRVKPETVRKELLCIKRILTIASKEWGIYLPHGNPVDRITVPPQPKRGRERRLEGNEQERILDAAKKYGGEISAIIRFAIETAMRRGEIAKLRWENIDIAKRVVTLPDTKNGDSRTVPLSTSALNILAEIPRNINGKVFSMRADSITHAFERCCKCANIANLRFHDLRHEATSRFFEMGLNIMEVSSITGHKDLMMLKRYTHLKAEDLARRLTK